MQQTHREYIAFISYRHLPLDADMAARLHRMIEQFRVPRALRKDGQARLGVVFRDEEELPASSDLSADIRSALEHSRYLIVVCTPDTPRSEWVRREIRTFLETHDRGHVLAVLAAGEPAQSFPQELTEGEIEPLALNVRAESGAARRRMLRREIPRLYAALIGCPYDSLVQRWQRRRRRQAAVAVGTVLAVALGFSGMLFWKNSQLEERNRELLRQRQEVQLSESRLLTARAGEELAAGDAAASLRDALAALPAGEEDGRPYWAPAESALLAGLGVFEERGEERVILTSSEIQLDANVRDLAVSEDGGVLVAMDAYGGVGAWELPSGKELWKKRFSTTNGPFRLSSGMHGHLRVDRENGRVLLLMERWALGLSLEDGSLLWSYRGDSGMENFLAVSRDNTRLACVECKMNTQTYLEGYLSLAEDGKSLAYDETKANPLSFHYDFDLVILDAATGEVQLRFPLEEYCGIGGFSVGSTEYTQKRTCAVFSADGRYFAGVVYTGEYNSITRCFLADLETGELRVLREEDRLLPVCLAIGEDRLYMLRVGEERLCEIILEAMDLETGEILWQTAARAEERSGYHTASYMEHCFLSADGWLYASADDMLYAFDPQSGELRAQVQLYSALLDMKQTQPYVFQFVLTDGYYAVGWISAQAGLHDSQGYDAGMFHLGEAAQARIAGGFLRAQMGEGTINGFDVSGGGCVAVVPAEDENRIVLRRARTTEGLATRRAVECPEGFRARAGLGRQTARLAADGTLLVHLGRLPSGEEPTEALVRLDAQGAPIGEPVFYRVSGLLDPWPLEDLSGLVELSEYGEMYFTDLSSGERKLLAERERVELSVSEGTVIVSNKTAAAAAYRSADGALLAARCDGSALRVWLDGFEQESVALPDGIDWSWRGTTRMDHILAVGENGCALLSGYAPDSEEDEMTSFALWSSQNGAWTLYPDDGAGDGDRLVALGRRAPVFAVVEPGDAVRVYGLGETRKIDLSIPIGSVLSLGFFPDDRHFAVYTSDGVVAVFDAMAEGAVYSGNIGATSGQELLCEFSPDGRRAYIGVSGTETLLCLDASSWTELGRAEGSVGFDSAREAVVAYDYSDGLSLWRVPAREELIAIAGAVLAEED